MTVKELLQHFPGGTWAIIRVSRPFMNATYEWTGYTLVSKLNGEEAPGLCEAVVDRWAWIADRVTGIDCLDVYVK